jgi:hypothetical protein
MVLFPLFMMSLGIPLLSTPTLQLSGLRILEIAVKHVQKTAPTSLRLAHKAAIALNICALGQTIRLPCAPD